MSAITAITFDQPSYTPGQTITATVEGEWAQADKLTVTTPDGATGTGDITVTEPVSATDTGGLTWKLASDNGTRAVLTATAAAAGTFTFTATAGAATGTATLLVRSPMLYGVNARVAGVIIPELKGVNFVKVFNAGMPTAWPGPAQGQVIPPGAKALVCFLPPPADLLAGKLDAQLAAFTAGAPPGSWLTAWQESNDPGNGIFQQPGIKTAADVAAVHGYLRDWTAKHAPHVIYGQDFGSSPIYGSQRQDCTAYSVPNLGFYSFDGYDRPTQNAAKEWVSPHTAAEVFAGLGQIRAKWPTATLAITETNTQRVTQDPASAGQWFDDAFAVAKQYGCVVFCTFWRLPGTGTGDVEFTPGAPYVAALNAIAAQAAGS